MNPVEEFNKRNEENIRRMAADKEVQHLSRTWFDRVSEYEYSYHFTWMGRPIIQFPQDIIALQELLWRIKPDVVVETGIAHGGSIIFTASMLELIGKGEVIGIDIDIREHNRKAIEEHPMMKRITMLEGSSIDPDIVAQVQARARGKEAVLVVLDSMHTHAHVLQEMQAYAPLVTKGSYLVVLDTVVEDMPADFFPDRPWGHGDNPKTAVHAFLREHNEFEIDAAMYNKLLLSVAPDGFLRRVK